MPTSARNLLRDDVRSNGVKSDDTNHGQYNRNLKQINTSADIHVVPFTFFFNILSLPSRSVLLFLIVCIRCNNLPPAT